MSVGLTAYMGMGMIFGLGVAVLMAIITKNDFFRIWSGAISILSGVLFAIPASIKIVTQQPTQGVWWGGALIVVSFHLIYLNYILYIRSLDRRKGSNAGT